MLKNILSIFLGLALALVLTEGILHATNFKLGGKPRHLMWSSPHFQVSERGAVRFLPNEQVRLVSTDNTGIELDVTYSTNNMGLIDDEDYRDPGPSVQRIAFVGDSYTAGQHGGTPWVPALRKSLTRSRPVFIYNLGVSGASVQHFELLLDEFSQAITLDKIVLLLISDDFMRVLWHPHTTDKEIFFCRDKELDKCSAENPVGSIIAYSAKPSDILALITSPTSKEPEENASSFRTLSLINNIYSILSSDSQEKLEKWLRVLIGKNIDAIEAIRDKFPNTPIQVIQLPQNSEVKENRYQHEADIADRLKQKLSTLGIEYYPALYQCDWSTDMYFVSNGHPNAKGYDNISRCVADLLNLDDKHSSKKPQPATVTKSK